MNMPLSKTYIRSVNITSIEGVSEAERDMQRYIKHASKLDEENKLEGD